MLNAIVLPALNRVLRSNDWAQQRLRLHAGKAACIECPPVRTAVAVTENGELASPSADHAPDVVVRITPGALLRLLAQDDAVWSEVQIKGDSDFATALHQVWQQLDWGIEEDLSRIFGDVAAHRIAAAGSWARLSAFNAVSSTIRNLTEYWTEERPVLALRRDVDAYNRQVDELRDDLARLEKRVAALQASAASGFSAEYGHNNATPPPGAGA